VAVDEIAKDKARDFISLCEAARESQTTEHFGARFAEGGSSASSNESTGPEAAAIS
jgi:hypothetical protein